MSRTIDERVVEMRFDNSQFERNVSTSMSSIDKLKQKLNFTGATKGLEEVGNAAKKVDMNGLSSGVESVRLKFSALQVAGVTALTNITNAALNAGKNIVSALTIDPIISGFHEYETQINAVQTILANTASEGATLNQVSAALDELNHYADQTIYNFTEMTRNIGTFTAAGVDLDTAVTSIKGIANLAAASGSSSAQAATAMYQLSQAIAAGKVQLMDWNSVVNAGMGGELFQNALKRTAEHFGTNVDAMIAKYGSFRESLTEGGWLTAEVLTETLTQLSGAYTEADLIAQGYTEQQAKDIVELANTATDAATKVKTFTQLWDTLKESAQSGWTETWEILIGDFEEAKSLLTELSETFGGIISQSADARNALLYDTMTSNWKKITDGITEAGLSADEFQEKVAEIAKSQGVDVDAMVKDYGSLEAAFKNGAISSDVLTQALEKMTGTSEEISKKMDELRGKYKTNSDLLKALTDAGYEYSDIQNLVKKDTEGQVIALNDLTDAQLMSIGYTSEQIQSIRDLATASEIAGGSLQEFIDNVSKPMGREMLVDTLRVSLRSLISIFEAVGKAWRDVFPPTTSEQLLGIIQSVRDFALALRPSEETLNNLQRTFRGLFSVLSIIKEAISAVISAIIPLFSGLDNLGGGFLSVTAAIGDWIYGLDQAIKQSDIFNAVLQPISKVIVGIATAIGDLASAIRDKLGSIEIPGLEAFHNFLARVQERMGSVGESAGSMSGGVLAAITTMGDALANSEFLKALQALWDGVQTVIGGIIDALSTLGSKFAEILGDINFDAVFDMINTGALAAVAVAVTKFFKTLSSPIEELADGLSGAFENVVGILDSVRGCFEAYQTQLKAGALMKIATAIGILAASLVAISLIDSEKLTGALAGISVLFGNLITAMALFGKFNIVAIKGVFGTITTMIGMSTAILILASALKKLGDLDLSSIVSGLVGIAGLTAIIVALAKALNGSSALVMRGATSMVIFGAAMNILAEACVKIAQLDWGELARGLTGAGVLLAEVAVFLNLTSGIGVRATTTAVGVGVLAGALIILASACEDFGQMKWGEIGKSLTSIGVLLAEIAVFTNLTGNAAHVISTSVALTIMGAAMKVFASAVQDFSGMDWDELARGLTGLAGALAAVTVALNLMPVNTIVIGTGLAIVAAALNVLADALLELSGTSWKGVGKSLTSLAGALAAVAVAMNVMPANMILTGTGLVIVAEAMNVLSESLSSFSGMSWEGIGKALTSLGGSLGVLAVGLRAMTGTLTGSAALVVAAGAIAVLAPSISLLGAMSWEGIAKGLITLAGAFTTIGVAGALLTPLVPTILGLGAAFALIGASVAAIGAGLLTAGAGLSAIAVGLAALITTVSAGAATIVASLTAIITGVASTIPVVVAKLGEGIIEFAKVIAEGAPAIGEAVKAIVLTLVDVLVECVPALAKGALELVTGVLQALADYTPQIVDAIFDFLVNLFDSLADRIPELIESLVDVFVAIFAGLIDALASLDTSTILKTAAGVGLLAGILLALSSITALIPGAMVGVLGLSALVVEIGAVLAAFGALAQIPGLTWIINEGGALLQSIGTAIGGFVGGIVGGIAAGLTSQLPQVASDLSGFMTNIQPFIEGARGIDPTVMDGVKTLAETILILTGANLLDGIASFLTGGSSLSQFAAELVPFGYAMREFSMAIQGLDPELVNNAATAGKTLSEMAATIPNSGGLVSFFTGENDMSAFASQLVPFGMAMRNFSMAIQGMDPELVTNAATAGKALAEMATTIPNSGGLVSFFTGENDMTTFAAQLVPFGNAMKSYSLAVSGMDVNAVVNSATAGQALTELAKTIPNTGGLISFFNGGNDMSEFGAQLISFGTNFSAYAALMANVDPNVVTTTSNAAKSLIELQNALPDNKLFTNETWLDDFGSMLADFGADFARYYSQISGIDAGQLRSASSEVKNLATLLKSIINTDFSGVSNFTDALKKLGNTSIDGFIEAFNGATSKVSTAATKMFNAIVTAANSAKGKISTAVNNITTGITDAIKSKEAAVSNAAESLMSKFVSAVEKKKSEINKAITSMLSEAVKTIRSKHSEFQSAGVYIVDGLASGIRSKTPSAVAAARSMAQQVEQAAKAQLDIHSPSGVFEEIGENVDLGTAKGIQNETSSVTEAITTTSSKLVEAAKKTLEIKEDSGSQIAKRQIGEPIMIGIAEGIEEDMTAEEAAAKKAENIANAFQEAIDSYEPNNTLFDLEYQLWEKTEGVDASPIEKANYQLISLQNELQNQKEIVAYANAEYQATLEQFGRTSEYTQEAYQKLLQQEIALADLVQEINDLRTSAMDEQWSTFEEYQSWLDENQEAYEKMGKSLEEIKAIAAEETGYHLNEYMDTTPLDAASILKDALNTLEVTFEIEGERTSQQIQTKATEIGDDTTTAISDGIKSGSSKVTSTTNTMLNDSLSQIKSQEPNWKAAGVALVDGFIAGMSSKIQEAAQKAAEMAMAAYRAAMAALNAASPSKLFMEVGSYVPMGFAIGIGSMGNRVESSSESMAQKAIQTVKNSITRLSEMVSEDIDTEPTIRPVLDLSDVEKNAGRISTILSSKQASSISARMNQSNQRGNIQNGSNNPSNTTTYQFTQNNYSPKALSRTDIYRQTKNQFSAFERMSKA